jgi:hypothetical protein
MESKISIRLLKEDPEGHPKGKGQEGKGGTVNCPTIKAGSFEKIANP